ncbi:MAG: GGDEF domain-containing protein [Gammaproteobacteria bacterium]|jgi:diguanylate cyclase (GGDEF)-like protein|nr:GGDEF domain-containing protein [Gammaproteobacteria bacterium]
MYKFRSQLRMLRNWWFRVCTGDTSEGGLDEEYFRRRILVNVSSSWLLSVLFLTFLTPLLIDLSDRGAVSARILFIATGVGVLLSMLTLRFAQNRALALNILLVIFAGAFAVACFGFGGTDSPTYSLLLLVPILAGIAGSVRLSVSWAALVFLFWTALLVAELRGVEFVQIIKPENHNLAILISHAALTIAVVAVVIIYAETNKALRYELQASNAELAHLSCHDQLTGLPNRRFYDERVALALQRSADQNHVTALLFLDLNDFKSINDTHGHGAGDKVLMTVARRLQDNLRETDLIARLGGDEFAAVLEDIRSPEEAARIADKISQSIEQPVMIRHQALHFSASIGIAVFPADGRQIRELEDQADRAMYYAKKRGLPVALSSLEVQQEPYPVRARNLDS